MQIKFCGGINTVTGANYLVEVEKSKFLVDCGLIQRENVCELENFEPFSYNPKEIKFVFITHAHLDHIGRLPKLIYEGFRGYIYSTLPTKELAKEILLDANKVIKEKCSDWDLDIGNIYNDENVEKILNRWEGINYHEKLNFDDLEIEFFDAGHILGSAFIKISDRNNSIVFSGDLGNIDPLLNKTEDLPFTDYLVLEATYGDKLHIDVEKRKDILEDIIEETLKEERVLIIPAFSLERSQEVLFDIVDLIEDRKVPEVRIFLDSPLSIRILNIYSKYPEFLNEEARNFFVKKDYSRLSYLKIIYDEEDERKIIEEPNPKIIISSSGMLQGGRILGIIKRFIEKENTTILFVGYQPEGSLGRKLLEGAKEVEIERKKYYVKAKIEKLLSYSGHKDQKGLLEWVYPQRKNIKKVFLVQGEENPKIILKSKIEDYLGIKAYIPKENEEIVL